MSLAVLWVCARARKVEQLRAFIDVHAAGRRSEGRARKVPVHPGLLAILNWWRRQIIMPTPSPSNDNASLGAIGLGGILNFYRREAA